MTLYGQQLLVFSGSFIGEIKSAFWQIYERKSWRRINYKPFVRKRHEMEMRS